MQLINQKQNNSDFSDDDSYVLGVCRPVENEMSTPI